MKGKLKMSHNLICAFCENVYKSGTKVCGKCEDYKGIMSVKEFDEIYG
jgi:hypothetical protein